MDNVFEHGFLKLSQLGETTEVAPPEDEGKETIVTCMSNCTYSQNPEKRCMLEGVSITMEEKTGMFSCGQYVQAQELQEVPPAQQQEEAPVKKQPGLPGQPTQ